MRKSGNQKRIENGTHNFLQKEECNICKKQISKVGLKSHLEAHSRKNLIEIKKQENKKINSIPDNCIFCNKFCKNKNSLTQHQIRCSNNPNKKVVEVKKVNWTPELRKKQSAIMKEKHNNTNRVWKIETLKLLSEKSKKFNKIFWTKEKRLRHADIMQKVINDNPNSYKKPKGTQGKISVFKNKYDEYFLMRSSWEVSVAELLEKMNINWTNKFKEGFIYYYNETPHKYYPDFYLKDYNIYIGVKKEVDNYKWNQFPHKLIILTLKEIKEIRKNNYNLNKKIKTLTYS